MKNLIPILFVFGLVLTACGGSGNNSTAKEAARESIQDQTVQPADLNNNTMTTTNNGAVPHYKCPNNCEGSGGAAQGTCPVCGTTYVHNQAFHAQTTTTTTTSQNTTTNDANSATNAAGEYHFICANGCAGGAGTQGNCASCGNALVHNAAYHN